MLTTAVFELVRQLYHAAEFGNVRWSAVADRIKALFWLNEQSRNTILNMRSGQKVC